MSSHDVKSQSASVRFSDFDFIWAEVFSFQRDFLVQNAKRHAWHSVRAAVPSSSSGERASTRVRLFYLKQFLSLSLFIYCNVYFKFMGQQKRILSIDEAGIHLTKDNKVLQRIMWTLVERSSNTQGASYCLIQTLVDTFYLIHLWCSDQWRSSYSNRSQSSWRKIRSCPSLLHTVSFPLCDTSSKLFPELF